MQELVPLLFGLVLGVGLGLLRPGIRLHVGLLLSVVMGVCATVVTGEFKSTWAYVLVDIPLVACASFLGLTAARRLRPMRLR